MQDNEKVLVNYRIPRAFKERLEKAARKRGMNVTSYVVDRLHDQVEADLMDLRRIVEREIPATS